MRTRYVRFLLGMAFFLVSMNTYAQVYKPGEVIVKLKGSSKSETAAAFVGKVHMKQQMKLLKSFNSFNMHHFKAVSGKTTQQLIEMYKTDPAVEYVEPNYIFNKLDIPEEAITGLTVDDVAAFSTPGEYSQTSAPIKAKEAWAELTSSGTKPIVAVIDTGVDYNHDVFTQSGSIWSNTGEIPNNGLDDDGNGYVDDVRGWNFVTNTNDPMDDNNHGTHVAGIILGVGQDIINTVPRDAARIQIMPLKFLDSNGSGSTSAAVAAIHYAINNGAKIINNSWGGPSYSSALDEALLSAHNTKLFVASAAGNSSSDNDSKPIYPASYPVPSQASIAATTSFDGLAFFSNFGSSTVHVGSPGSSIKSTLPGNTFGNLSGTSMATPVVAGIAALLMYERPSMIGFQVKEVIFDQSESASGLVGKVNKESRVNVKNAVVSGKSITLNSSQPGYTVSPPATFNRGPASSVEEGGGCGTVGDIGRRGPGGFPWSSVLLMIPFGLALWLKFGHKFKSVNRRRHDRFVIDTDVTMNVGGKQLIGKVNSISQGGIRVCAEELMEKGSVVTLSISNPDGSGSVEVKGNIVWSEEQGAAGIQFGSNELAQATVAGWTRNLKKEPDN